LYPLTIDNIPSDNKKVIKTQKNTERIKKLNQNINKAHIKGKCPMTQVAPLALLFELTLHAAGASLV
jgi:hypothetical protein